MWQLNSYGFHAYGGGGGSGRLVPGVQTFFRAIDTDFGMATDAQCAIIGLSLIKDRPIMDFLSSQ